LELEAAVSGWSGKVAASGWSGEAAASVLSGSKNEAQLGFQEGDFFFYYPLHVLRIE
jgi:hypothetical protein